MGKQKPRDLAEWMKEKEIGDADLAPQLGLDRVSISRMRRKIHGASRKTAEKLEKITGLPWHTFIGRGDRP